MQAGGQHETSLLRLHQLGRFCQQGWGTKAVIDFINKEEKTVTVARVDPSATRLLVLKRTLTGSSGWGKDLFGCSVEAVIKPPPGRADEFLRRRLVYGNHLPWVYGDHTTELNYYSPSSVFFLSSSFEARMTLQLILMLRYLSGLRPLIASVFYCRPRTLSSTNPTMPSVETQKV